DAPHRTAPRRPRRLLRRVDGGAPRPRRSGIPSAGRAAGDPARQPHRGRRDPARGPRAGPCGRSRRL
ncbi:MAG: hypothetical protein AVDCRST_MAG04-3989, partial [uncultured Acetobacteraceae bacterium]